MKINSITKAALFIVLFFIVSNIIPQIYLFGTPFTFQTLLIMLIPFFFTYKEIIIWYFSLISLCAIGFPIMSGFSGGFGVLLGPTAGFIYGWLIKMLIIKYFLNYESKTIKLFIVLLIATIIDLLIGAIWLSYLYSSQSIEMIINVMIGFLPFGIVKIILAIIIIKKLPKNIFVK